MNRSLIQFIADFAPYSSSKLQAVYGIPNYQFSHDSDFWAGNAPISGSIFMDTSTDNDQSHSLETFLDQVANLPDGYYYYDIETGKLIPYD